MGLKLYFRDEIYFLLFHKIYLILKKEYFYNKMKRKLSIDFLRTLIIIESILLHLRTKMSPSFFIPFKYIQKNFFKVGTFFFIISGIMLYLVYYPRYQKDKQGIRNQLIKKGIYFSAIYFCYINILRLINKDKIPMDLYTHFFRHPYFAKVIFTFSFIFLFAPLFLHILTKIKNTNYLLILSACLMIISHLMLNLLSLPYFWTTTFFDSVRNIYPVFPNLSVYCIGIWLGSIFYDYQKKPHYLVGIYVYLISFYYVGVILFEIDSFKLFWESSNILIFVILVDIAFKYLISDEENNVFNNVFLLGKRSLITFIGSNFLIVLLPNLKENAVTLQLTVILAIVLITYSLAWSYEYILTKKTYLLAHART